MCFSFSTFCFQDLTILCLASVIYVSTHPGPGCSPEYSWGLLLSGEPHAAHLVEIRGAFSQAVPKGCCCLKFSLIEKKSLTSDLFYYGFYLSAFLLVYWKDCVVFKPMTILCSVLTLSNFEPSPNNSRITFVSIKENF